MFGNFTKRIWEYETAINLFKTNYMIRNSKKDQSKFVLNINGIELIMESSVKLLGI